MNRLALWTVSCALLLAGCAFSMDVPTEEWSGTYIASYPFGPSTLIIRPDHTFSQTVVVGNERAELSGSWRANGGRIHFSQLIIPADGFGNLEKDWRRQVRPVSHEFERIWWNVWMSSGATYPYKKQ